MRCDQLYSQLTAMEVLWHLNPRGQRLLRWLRHRRAKQCEPRVSA
jgi:hypothetical protein